jgi:hypothetical protein
LFHGSTVFLRNGASSTGHQSRTRNRKTDENEIPENSVLSHGRPFLFST